MALNYKTHLAYITTGSRFYYFLSAEELYLQKMCFALYAERIQTKQQQEQFLEIYDQRYPALEAEYKKRNIVYRESNRKNVLAWKQYDITHDIKQITDVFKQAFEEFKFLEPEVDVVLTEMAGIKDKQDKSSD